MLNLRSFVVFGILVMMVAGCINVAPQGKDAIAVWQHQEDTWDVHYSVYDQSTKQWFTPSGAKSAPIAVDSGDDHDPDVSSNDESAVSVWTKQTGGNTVYYSMWDGANWTSPVKLSSGDQDTDPSVAMDGAGDALAVWVTKGTMLYSSYYTTGVGWTTPEKLNTSGISKLSLPEVAYSERDGNYYLVFTGTDTSGSTNAYAAAYSKNGWTSPLLVGAKAVLDNNVPTTQRTGIDVALNKAEVTVVWPGPNNELYSAKLGAPANHYADGMMPDVSYDSSDVPNGAYSDDEDLYHQPNVLTTTSENTISAMKASDDRNSLTFIRERKIGLDIWWTKVIPTSQIYYSYYESGAWQGVDKIDASLDGSYNRNPAVSPLREMDEPDEGPYCGDKVINLWWEQCEVGVPCANPNDWCNVNNCQCYSQYPPGNDSVDCAANSWASAFGFPIWAPGMICIDNCKANFGAEWRCDPTCNCVNKPPLPPPNNISCAANSGGVMFGINFFKAGDMCVDDCDQLGENYECDVKTCTCDQPPPPREVSCGSNTWGDILFGKPGFKAGDLCSDDCSSYGSNYECEVASCTCKEKDDTSFYCASHTMAVIASDKNNFNPATMVCEDNCFMLGFDYDCVTSSCTCVRNVTKANLSCGANTIGTQVSDIIGIGLSGYDASKQVCVDDCAETFEMLEATCNAQSCICEYAETCAANTDDTIIYGVNYYDGGQCIDNCDKLGMGYTCDAKACLCRRSNDTANVYCAANTDDALERGVEKRGQAQFDSTTMQCIDNCKEVYPEGYVCNSVSCLCEPTEKQEISCSFNTQYVDATDKNVYKSSQQCSDDCAEYMGSDYECNVGSCTCTKKKKEFNCFYNTLDGMMDFTGNYTNKYKPGDMCKDDCDVLSYVGAYECDMASCKCKATTPCASNTLDAYNSGTNSYTGTSTTKPPMCSDNCEKVLGDGYTCDLESCICRPSTDGGKINCAANTGNAYINDAIGTTGKGYTSSMQCVDDCKKNFDDNMVCDSVSCYCVPGEGTELSCSAHTEYVSLLDVNKFDASNMKCEDDCAEYTGSEYVCNAQSCTCTKKQDKPEVSCAANSKVGTTTTSLNDTYPNGWSCMDDCQEMLGADSFCDSKTCTCYTILPPPITVSCAENNLTGLGLDEVYGANAWLCQDDCEKLTGGSYYCDTGSCTCLSNLAVCGDGVIGYGEGCDYGSSSTNTCASTDTAFPDYCTESCQCKKIEHSPRCGDGKITGYEGCDGGNVKTNICPTGYKCDTPSCSCIVEEGTGQCGDGRVTPPEECDHGNSYTDDCPMGKTCYSCACVDPGDVPEEAYCGNNKREGSEECDGNDDSACASNEYCSYCSCVEEAQDLYCGDDVVTSPEECEDDHDCDSGEYCSACQCVAESVTLYCGDGIINLNEQCESDGDCSASEICYNCQCLAPPSPNCASYCASEGYETNLGTGYTSESCSAAAAEDEVMCYVTCLYVKMGSWSNPAGTTTCCCKDVYREACPPTAGGGCNCPDKTYVKNTLCPSHAP